MICTRRRKSAGHGADASQLGPLRSRPRHVSASDCGWTVASPSCRGARRRPAAASDRAKSLTDTAHQTRIGAPTRRTRRHGEGKPRRRPSSRRGDPTGRRGSFLSPPSTAPTTHHSVLTPHIRWITHTSSCALWERAEGKDAGQQEGDRHRGDRVCRHDQDAQRYQSARAYPSASSSVAPWSAARSHMSLLLDLEHLLVRLRLPACQQAEPAHLGHFFCVLVVTAKSGAIQGQQRTATVAAPPSRPVSA